MIPMDREVDELAEVYSPQQLKEKYKVTQELMYTCPAKSSVRYEGCTEPTDYESTTAAGDYKRPDGRSSLPRKTTSSVWHHSSARGPKKAATATTTTTTTTHDG